MKERRHEADSERRETGGDPLHGRGLGQGDIEGAVLVNNFLFNFFKLFQPATASFRIKSSWQL